MISFPSCPGNGEAEPRNTCKAKNSAHHWLIKQSRTDVMPNDYGSTVSFLPALQSSVVMTANVSCSLSFMIFKKQIVNKKKSKQEIGSHFENCEKEN